MVKRDNGTRRASSGTTRSEASGAMDPRVIAFAEQLGRFVGTIQAKADGWTDPKTLDKQTLNKQTLNKEALTKQIASVRDSAARLLDQLADGATRAPKKKAAVTVAPHGNRGRSGGLVDAPGKKHRQAAPADPDASIADAQANKMRMAKPMEKVHRRRGRG
jgi:hypothetical protein